MDLLTYLTPVERKKLKERARVHRLLQKGYGVREIARLLSISSTTVVNTKKYLGLKIKKTPHSQTNKQGNKVPWKLG